MDRWIVHIGELLAPVLMRELLGTNEDGTTRTLDDVLRKVVSDELADIAHIADVQGLVTTVEDQAGSTVAAVREMFTPIIGQLNGIPSSIIGQIRNLLPHFP